ncbi:hypothetical protein [Primorskyibacter flagellatus]|nr:hypothetical protein [Primorskyibacter flagellatus]
MSASYRTMLNIGPIGGGQLAALNKLRAWLNNSAKPGDLFRTAVA